MLRYVWRELVRNPRRTLASLVGVTLGVGLFSGVLFFIDGSGATMTKRALAPLALDMQRVLTDAARRRPQRFERAARRRRPRSAPGRGRRSTLTVSNDGAAPANEVVVNDEPPPPLTLRARHDDAERPAAPRPGRAEPARPGTRAHRPQPRDHPSRRRRSG